MSVHNGARYLREALESVLAQTYGDFELIVVDDGSSDQTNEILREYANKDSRVRLIVQENQGLTKSLNSALALARGEFVARMDADDICFPERFEKQVEFLVQHPEFALVGTAYWAIDQTGARLGIRSMSTDPVEIDRRHLRGNTSLAHPAIMVRREMMEKIGGYDERYPTSQDLDLFLRLAEIGPITNINQPLLYYRWHEENISVCKTNRQDRDCTAIVAAAHRRRGLTVPRGLPVARWDFRRVMARKYAAGGNRRQALQFAWQAVCMRPISLRSWYTMFLACVPRSLLRRIAVAV